jgi:hypothetical protein
MQMGETTIIAMEKLMEKSDGELARVSRKELTDLVNQDEPVLEGNNLDISDLAPLFEQLKIDPAKAKSKKIDYTDGKNNDSYIVLKTSHLNGEGNHVEDTFILYAAGISGDRVYVNTLKIRRKMMVEMYDRDSLRNLLYHGKAPEKTREKIKRVLDTEVSHYGHIIKWSADSVSVDHLYDTSRSKSKSSIDTGQLLKEAVTNFRYVNQVMKTMLVDTEKAIDLLNEYVKGDEEDPNYGKIERHYDKKGLLLNLKGVDDAEVPVTFAGREISPQGYETFARVVKGRESHSRFNGYRKPVEEGMVFFWKELREQCTK